MNRKEATKTLSKLTEQLINPKNDSRVYWAREVTFDYGSKDTVRVDYMKFVPINNSVSGIEKGDFYCFEVKSSPEDFHSGHGQNFIGEYNYLIMPEEAYEKVKKEIPYGVGVYCPNSSWEKLEIVKRAKKRDRQRPMNEMLLIMFRSAARDRKENKNERS